MFARRLAALTPAIAAAVLVTCSGGANESRATVYPPAATATAHPEVRDTEVPGDREDRANLLPTVPLATGTPRPGKPIATWTPSPAATATLEPTATPTVAPTATVQPPASLTVRDIVCAPGYAWDCEFALAIVWCESRNDPLATGRAGERGLFQLKPEFHEWRAGGESLYDPVANTRAAYSLWLDSGWQPWTCARTSY